MMHVIYGGAAIAGISLLMAWWSLKDYQGDRAVGRVRMQHRKERMKGSIVFHKGKSKHYSSYSR